MIDENVDLNNNLIDIYKTLPQFQYIYSSQVHIEYLHLTIGSQSKFQWLQHN